jgi:hypothetical protein
MTLPKNVPLLAAALIVVAGIAAYVFWLREPAMPNVSIEGEGAVTEAHATFLALAAQLEPVAFDASVLSDPRFLALVDITTAILPEDAGRTDPFGRLSP